MNLIINNHIINSPMVTILTKVKMLSNGYLSDIRNTGMDVRVSCPFHKGGVEKHASCNVCASTDLDIVYGTFHCFSCGESGSLPKLISECLRCSYKEAESWLIENFSSTLIDETVRLDDIELTPVRKQYLDPSVLKQYEYYHPYMWFRGLSKQVVDAFKIGYDNNMRALTFPVWDERNNLVMITKRSVDCKKFYIPQNVDKPVYLLNFIKSWGIDNVIVCESQINALTAWSWGYPAIALFGTGSKKQMDILNKSSIRFYTLAFDGDDAGRKGTQRFLNSIRKDVFVDVKKIPEGQDLNDLTKEIFDNLPNIS